MAARRTLTYGLAGLALGFAVYMGIRMLPDLRRYIRIHSM